MAAWSIPPIFFKEWPWLVCIAAILVILLFLRRRYPPPFPKSRAFFSRHPRAVARTTDAFLIGAVLLWSTLLFHPVREVFGAWHTQPEPQEIRAVMISSSLIDMVVWSGVAGLPIGFLSFFQSNLTRFKRILLLVLCLLPALFTATALLTGFAENWRLTIQFGATFSAPTWVVNGPGVLIGQSLPDVLWRIMRKLHLVSGDLPD